MWDYRDEVCLKTFELNCPILWIGLTSLDADVAYVILDWSNMGQEGKRKSRAEWRLVQFDLSTGKSTRTLIKETGNAFVSSTMRDTLSDADDSTSQVIGTLISVISGPKLFIWKSTQGSPCTGSGTVHKHVHVRDLVSLDIHPKEERFATGDCKGQIILWHGIESEEWSKMHWHPHAVRCLKYSTEGAFLASGGEEAVFVLWQLESGARTYLPRLGACLNSITTSPDGQSYAILFSNNTLLQLNPTLMKEDWRISGMAMAGRSSSKTLLKSGLTIDPQTNALLINGASSTGNLQFFDPFKDRQVSELKITLRNQVCKTDDEVMPETWIEYACFSSSGKSLISADVSTLSTSQASLKFWEYSNKTKEYALNTRIENPHDCKMTAMAYHPTLNVAVTAGIDGQFKLWTKVERTYAPSMKKTDGKVGGTKWSCRAVAQYREEAIHSVAFSKDGSLLAVSYGSRITLWDPITNALLTVLVYPLPQETIEQVLFAGDSKYLMARTRQGIYVWNLATCQLWWSYAVKSSQIVMETCDKDGKGVYDPLVVVSLLPEKNKDKQNVTTTRLLFFHISSPTPIAVGSVRSNISSMILYPQSNSNRMDLLYMDQTSSIYRVDITHLLPNVIEQEEEIAIKTSSSHVQENVLEAMYGKSSPSVASTRVVHEGSVATSTKRKHESLFDAPAYVLPPLETLFGSFMDSILDKRSVQPCLKKRKRKGVYSSTTTISNAKDFEQGEEEVMYKAIANQETFDAKMYQQTYAPFVQVFSS